MLAAKIMETHVWQALPQRKRKSDGNKTGAAVICAVNEDLNTAGPDVQHQQRIVDNVAARSCLKRANATLESRDGCAGEFYECTVSNYLNEPCALLGTAS